jgi:hypothetical protein
MRNFTPLVALICTALFTAELALAQVPVIPGASGYGINTSAGRGGQIFRVTNLNYDGEGSLKACIDASGPRVCVFEVSGAIDFNYYHVNIRNPNITIAGQTAPAPGIMLINGGLRIATSDVLIQHLAIRVGDHPNIERPDNADAMKIESEVDAAQNIVIDHVSLSWAIDENISSYIGAGNVTIRNSIISEALDDSMHPKGPHSKAAQFGRNDGGFSFVGNLLAHNAERNPKTLTSDFVLANNVIYNWSSGGTNLAIREDGSEIRHSVVGNLYIGGADTGAVYPVTVRSHAETTEQGAKIYLADNRWTADPSGDQWAMVKNLLSFSPRVDRPAAWVDGMDVISALSNNGDDVLKYVLNNAGSRPSERDSVDARIVEEVQRRTGQIKNCVSADGSDRCRKNGGGWPMYAENRRALVLPDDPNGDSDRDGYTNLEEWLHEMAKQVENTNATDVTGEENAKPRPPVLIESG